MPPDLQPVAFPARRYRFEVALLFSVLVLFAILAARYEWFETLDQLYYDLLLGSAPIPLDERIVIVGIDEQSLDVGGRWPWSRAEQAALIERVLAQQPEALLVDVIYSNTTTPVQDERLSAALSSAEATAIALPIIFDSVALHRPPVEVLPVPELLTAVDALGHVHVQLERDSIARGIYLHQGVGEAHWPHLALALAAQLEWLAEPVVRCGNEPSTSLAIRQCQFRYIPFVGPPGTVPQISALALLNGSIPTRALQGKVVMLGLTAAGVADWVTSPVSGGGRPISGVEYNANVFNALIQGRLIEPAPGWLVRLLCALFAATAAILLPRCSPKGMLLAALLFAVLPFAVSAGSQLLWQQYLPLSAAALAGLLAYPFWSWRRHEIAWRYIDQEMDRVAAARKTGIAYAGVSAPVQDWQPLARQAGSLLDLEIDSDATAQEATGIQLDAAGRGAVLLLAEQGLIALRRPADAPALTAAQQSLLETLFVELMEPTVPVPELPGESLAIRIRALRTQNRVVQQGLEFSMQALEKMNSGVAVVAGLGQIALSNSEFIRMTDVAAGAGNFADASFRKRLSARLPTPIGRSWLEIWREVVVDTGNVGFESQLADGRLVFVSCAPLGAAQAGTWIITCTDVTEITTAQNMREEALAFLSHDLRSPIVSVLALLRRGPMDETAREIERYANKSLMISEQFLQFSRLASQPNVETYELDVISVLSNAVDQVYAQSEEQGVAIDAAQLATLPDAGVVLQGNGELLERTFVNLLSNAIKYSNAGSRVVVRAVVTATEVAITVADEGVGIPAEDLPRLFEPYFRSAQPELARRRGAGLGLRFAKTVVERHSGVLEVQSEVGVGSTFVAKLPRLTDGSERPAASAEGENSDVQ